MRHLRVKWNSKAPPAWTSILTALVLSAATAALVIIHEWGFWQAFVVVIGMAAVFILVLLALLLWLSPPSDRSGVLPELKKEMRKEFRAMLESLFGR